MVIIVVLVLPESALEPAGVLSSSLVSSQPEAAVEKGKDGTVWMVLQADGHPGRKHSQNVLMEAAGPQQTQNATSRMRSLPLCMFLMMAC